MYTAVRQVASLWNITTQTAYRSGHKLTVGPKIAGRQTFTTESVLKEYCERKGYDIETTRFTLCEGDAVRTQEIGASGLYECICKYELDRKPETASAWVLCIEPVPRHLHFRGPHHESESDEISMLEIDAMLSV